MGFREWLRTRSGADDVVRVADGARRRSSDLLAERDGLVRMACDVIGATFTES